MALLPGLAQHREWHWAARQLQRRMLRAGPWLPARRELGPPAGRHGDAQDPARQRGGPARFSFFLRILCKAPGLARGSASFRDGFCP